MQPSYSLLPATSYPKIVGGMCHAEIGTHIDRVKTPIRKQPIRGQETK